MTKETVPFPEDLAVESEKASNAPSPEISDQREDTKRKTDEALRNQALEQMNSPYGEACLDPEGYVELRELLLKEPSSYHFSQILDFVQARKPTGDVFEYISKHIEAWPNETKFLRSAKNLVDPALSAQLLWVREAYFDYHETAHLKEKLPFLPQLESLSLENREGGPSLEEMSKYPEYFPSVNVLQIYDRLTSLRTLATIPRFPWLEELWLQRAENLESLAGAEEEFPQLKKMVLGSAFNLVSLQHCPNAASLEVLDIDYARSLEGFENSPHFPELRILILEGLRQVTTLEGLQPLPTLEKMELDGVNIESFEGFPEVPKIKELSLGTFGELANCEGLPSLSTLKKLVLDLGRINSLQHMPPLPMLEELDFRCCRFLQDFQGIPPLPKLKTLTIHSLHDLVSLRGLSDLSELEELKITVCSSLTSVEALPPLPKLKRVKFYELESIEDLDGFPELPELEKLTIDRCNSLRTLRHAPHLPKLQELVLKNCNNLESLEGLDELPSLKKLHIESCPKMESLEGIGFAPEVETLFVFRCGLRTLENMPLMPNAKDIRIEGCTTLTDIKGFEDQEFPELEELWLSAVSQTSTLQSLPSALPKLREMYIGGWHDLKSLKGMPFTPQLQRLWLSGGQNLTSFEMGRNATFPELNTLIVHSCRGVGDISSFPPSPKLEHLSIDSSSFIKIANLPRQASALKSISARFSSLVGLDGIAEQYPLIRTLVLDQSRNLVSIIESEKLQDLENLSAGGCENLVLTEQERSQYNERIKHFNLELDEDDEWY